MIQHYQQAIDDDCRRAVVKVQLGTLDAGKVIAFPGAAALRYWRPAGDSGSAPVGGEAAAAPDEELLGRAGMGEVSRVYDKRLGRVVAKKGLTLSPCRQYHRPNNPIGCPKNHTRKGRPRTNRRGRRCYLRHMHKVHQRR